MNQLLVFGIVIVLFALVVMIFSHSQSLQRFAVLEFLMIVGVAGLWYMGITQNKDFMTEQYLSLFSVYLGDAQRYAGELEYLETEGNSVEWKQEGETFQNLLNESLPVTTVDGKTSSFMTAAIYERIAEGQYSVRVLQQVEEDSLSEKDCMTYINQLGDSAIQSKKVVYEETPEKTGVLVYTDTASVVPRYVLLTEISLAPMQMNISKMQRDYTLFAGAFLIVATLVLAVVVLLQGRQMRSLVRIAARVAAGKEDWDSLKKSADSSWMESNEMRGLKNSLGQIASDVARMNYMKYKVLQNYYRFAPKQIEQILGKTSILEVEPGDKAKIMGTLAFVSYSQNTGVDEASYLQRVNKEYHYLGEKQKEYEGILLSDNSDLSTMQLLFQKETQKALNFGVEVAMNKENTSREQAFVLLHRTSFLYGVIGDEEQAFTYLLSNEMKMLERYVDKLRSIGIRMAVTEAVYERIEKETTVRYIGYLEDGGYRFKLYEVLDACTAKERQRRIDSKDKFQRALEMFYQGDYYLGRNAFTEVLKESPNDEVAKWYLFLCEKCLNTSQGKASCALFSE